MSIRGFRWKDIPVVAELLDLVGKKDGSDRPVTTSLLTEIFRQPNLLPEKDCFLFEDGPRLQAYVLLQRELPIGRVVLELGIHPDYRETGIEREIVTTALERGSALGASALHICVDTSAFWSRLLKQEGFELVRRYWVMEWEDERLPQMELPPEFLIETFQPGDAERLTQVQNASFEGSWGFNPNTVEEIAYRAACPTGNPPEILFLSNNGTTAGYCWTATNGSPEKLIGFIEMVGVAPDYRGRRLGRPTALAGMYRLRARGAGCIRLNVDGQNVPAIKMYTSLGFKKAHELHWFEFSVSEGSPTTD